LNIGYVLFQFPALTETFVLNEIVELINRGHKIHVFSISSPQGYPIHNEIDDFNLSIVTHQLIDPKKKYNQVKLIFQSLGSFGWSYPCESLGGKVLSIAAAKSFCKIARVYNLDVLHAHFNGIPTQTALLMSKKLKIPFTFDAHASDIFVKPHTRSLLNRMQEASAVITPSFYNKRYLHELTQIQETKIHVVRACPKVDKFYKVNQNHQALSILTIGRLVEKKGIKYGILAVKELVKEYPSIQYSIIGSGILETDLRHLVNKLNLQKNVKFLGNLDDDSQLDELRKTAVFILPCVEAKNKDADGIPVSLMEAMSLGIPTVSTRISGIPELINNGVNGILVESKNPLQMANAIRALFENGESRMALGVNSRKKILSEFNIHSEITKLLEIWETVKK
jgi:colanic acid/amylovoran biosynthesis glycosyltransferase